MGGVEENGWNEREWVQWRRIGRVEVGENGWSGGEWVEWRRMGRVEENWCSGRMC